MSEDNKNWGHFFKQLFDQGQVFYEELLHENQRLREKVALYENDREHRGDTEKSEAKGLAAELKSVRAHRDQLAKELTELKDRIRQTEREHRQFEQAYQEIERQNANFASLYVASYQLHSSLDFEVVLQRIVEVVTNLIGAEEFEMHIFNPETNSFTLATGEGVEDRIGDETRWGDNFLTRIAHDGQLYVAPDPKSSDNDAPPVAALPLLAADELIGVLLIQRLLLQKKGFEPIDMELFDLLASHAASALMASKLYGRSQRKASTLENMMNLLSLSPPPSGTKQSGK